MFSSFSLPQEQKRQVRRAQLSPPGHSWAKKDTWFRSPSKEPPSSEGFHDKPMSSWAWKALKSYFGHSLMNNPNDNLFLRYQSKFGL